jgi:hydroxymethylpyrimidine pyrophosphatase-like HAD family hydrolase
LIPEAILKCPFFSYIVSANGAMLTEQAHGRVLLQIPLTTDDGLWAYDLCRKNGAACLLYFTDRYYSGLKRILSRRDYYSGKVYPLRQLVARSQVFRPALVMRRRIARSAGTLIKIESYFSSDKICAAARKEFSDNQRIEAVSTIGFNLEITARGVNKGAGIAFLCKELGIGREHVLVFGDSGNDLSMRDTAGWFVAMGNATRDVKNAADEVTKEAALDGVAHTLHRLLQDAIAG